MAKMDENQIDELLRQAEQRLEKGASAAAVRDADADADTVQLVPRPTADVPKEDGGTRSAIKQQTAKAQARDSAGSDWFDLPKTDLTADFKRDWQILRMRGVLDPKHQKKALRAEAPKYSQVGRIVEGPTDFFSARLSRKDRRQTILGEVMRDHSGDKFKSKYSNIQQKKTSGKKAFYRKVVAQRRRGQS